MAIKFGIKNPWPKFSAMIESKGHAGSTRGQIVQECAMAIRFGRKYPRPRRNALTGSKVMQGSAGVNRGSNCLYMPHYHQIWWEEPLTGV